MQTRLPFGWIAGISVTMAIASFCSPIVIPEPLGFYLVFPLGLSWIALTVIAGKLYKGKSLWLLLGLPLASYQPVTLLWILFYVCPYRHVCL
jgi:hypothetical protein